MTLTSLSGVVVVVVIVTQVRCIATTNSTLCFSFFLHNIPSTLLYTECNLNFIGNYINVRKFRVEINWKIVINKYIGQGIRKKKTFQRSESTSPKLIYFNCMLNILTVIYELSSRTRIFKFIPINLNVVLRLAKFCLRPFVVIFFFVFFFLLLSHFYMTTCRNLWSSLWFLVVLIHFL